MPTMQQLSTTQAQKEVLINENFDACSSAAILSHKNQDTEGIVWKYNGGRIYNPLTGTIFDYADGELTLTNDATNYIQIYSNTIFASINRFWEQSIPLYQVVVSGGYITTITDKRIQILVPNNAAIFDGLSFDDEPFGHLVFSNTSSLLQFKVHGGSYRRTGDTRSIISDNSSLTLTTNATNYIYINTSTNTFAVATTLPDFGILLYQVILNSSSVITTLRDYRNSTNVVQTDKYYEVKQGSLAANTVYSFTHNLYLGSASEKPVFLRTMAKCITAEKGYSIGDECEFVTGATQNDANKTGYFSSSMANINFVIGNNIWIADLTGGNIGNLVQATLANWEVVVRVYVV